MLRLASARLSAPLCRPVVANTAGVVSARSATLSLPHQAVPALSSALASLRVRGLADAGYPTSGGDTGSSRRASEPSSPLQGDRPSNGAPPPPQQQQQQQQARTSLPATQLPRVHPTRMFYPGQTYEPSDLNPASGPARPAWRPRSKACPLSRPGAPEIDYKNVRLLSRFVSETGKIIPRRLTGVCAKKQRALARAIKRARVIGLMPMSSRVPMMVRKPRG